MDMFVNAYSVALGYLDLINELEIIESEAAGLIYGAKLQVTSGCLAKMNNEKMGEYLAFQIGQCLPIPDHWKSAFHTLMSELSTKRIAEEGKGLEALEAILSGPLK